jgi:hypothetical protein
MTEPNYQRDILVGGMRQAMQAYEAGQVQLDRLAWVLKSRIAALREFGDEAWADELKAIWNQLEVVNAFFIDSGRDQLNVEEREVGLPRFSGHFD